MRLRWRDTDFLNRRGRKYGNKEKKGELKDIFNKREWKERKNNRREWKRILGWESRQDKDFWWVGKMKETMTTERKIEKEHPVKKPTWRITANCGTDKYIRMEREDEKKESKIESREERTRELGWEGRENL